MASLTPVTRTFLRFCVTFAEINFNGDFSRNFMIFSNLYAPFPKGECDENFHHLSPVFLVTYSHAKHTPARPCGNNHAGSEGSLHMSTAPCKEVFWRSCRVDTTGLPSRGVTWQDQWYCWWEVVCKGGTSVSSLVPAGGWKNRWCAVVCPAVVNWGWKEWHIQHTHNTSNLQLKQDGTL